MFSSDWSAIPEFISMPGIEKGLTPQTHILHPELSGLSNCDHGTTMQEVMENIRGLPYEVLAFFDKNYRKIYEFTHFLPDENSYLTPNSWRSHIHAIVHNHPSGASFSVKDVLDWSASQYSQAIVVSKYVTYTVEGLPHDWANQAPFPLNTPEGIQSFLGQAALFAQMLGEPLLTNDFGMDALAATLSRNGCPDFKYSVHAKSGALLHYVNADHLCDDTEYYKYLKLVRQMFA